jgi:hypothetical protein
VVELAVLARFRFENKPEQAVREGWIAPLLLRLGYGGETLNHVEYAEKLDLAAPFRRIGRRRVEIDYRPTVRGHGLWIIEAKAHGGDEWEEAISQAWLYATHPEVDVPFMVIADGARTAVYDTYKPDWDDPVVDIATKDLVAEFPKLAAVLSAAQVTSAIRRRRMRHLGGAMRAEVMPGRLEEYVADMRRMVQESLPVVMANQRAVLGDQLRREDQARADLVRSGGLFVVGVFTNQPFALNLESARQGIEYVRALDAHLRGPEFVRLLDAARHRGGPNGSDSPRMFWMLRVTALEIYLALLGDHGCGEHATEEARRAIRDHLLNFPTDPVARAAHRLERVLPVFVLRSLLTPGGVDLAQLARELQQNWGDELRLRARLDADRLLVQAVTQMSQQAWNSMPWNEESLNAAAQAIEVTLPSIDYRKDGARGAAGDPFLESYLRIDDLVSTTLGQVARYFRRDLLDDDVVTAVAALGASRDEIDDRFIKGPAKALLSRVADSQIGD